MIKLVNDPVELNWMRANESSQHHILQHTDTHTNDAFMRTKANTSKKRFTEETCWHISCVCVRQVGLCAASKLCYLNGFFIASSTRELQNGRGKKWNENCKLGFSQPNNGKGKEIGAKHRFKRKRIFHRWHWVGGSVMLAANHTNKGFWIVKH